MSENHVRLRPARPQGTDAWAVDCYDSRGRWVWSLVYATKAEARRDADRVRKRIRREARDG